MATIRKVSGKSYRVCTNADTDTWDELSFKTQPRDVIFDDNNPDDNAENNLGAIKGITDDLSCEENVEYTAVSVKGINKSLGGFSFKVENGKKQVSTDGGNTWSNFSGGVDLLWTNPTPTKTFDAQTVSIDLSGYESVIIVSKGWYATATYTPFKIIIPKDNIAHLINGIQKDWTPGSSLTNFETYHRWATANDSGVIFSKGWANGTTGVNACIPLEIYGCGVTLE
jgi:hypothetical protein